jgi:hypothetical protein
MVILLWHHGAGGIPFQTTYTHIPLTERALCNYEMEYQMYEYVAPLICINYSSGCDCQEDQLDIMTIISN